MGRNLIAWVGKTCGHRQADPPCRPLRSFERPGGPRRTGKPTIPGLVQTVRGPKHHEPARPPCPQSSGTCRQGLAGSRGPRARREQPVVSLARSGAEAQLASETLIPQEWLNLALSDATAAAVQTLRAGARLARSVLDVTWAKAWAVPRA